MATLATLRTEVLTWLDETSTGGNTETAAGYALKRAHKRRLAQYPWPFLEWPKIESFSTVAGQTLYSLHQRFHRPLWFYNQTLKDWMREMPDRQLDVMGVDNSQTLTGSARDFRLAGMWPVATQPSAATTLSVSSTASETGTLIVEGDTSDGYTTETIAMSGTSGTGSVSFTLITGLTKTSTWNGTLTLSTSGGTTLVKLYAAENGRQYPVMEMLQVPSAAETIRYRFTQRPRELSAANDVPQIPEPHTDILVYDALLMMTAYNARISSAALSEIKQLQQEAERQLFDAYMTGQSLGAYSQSIRDTELPWLE
jgi:hypothetical protein